MTAFTILGAEKLNEFFFAKSISSITPCDFKSSKYLRASEYCSPKITI